VKPGKVTRPYKNYPDYQGKLLYVMRIFGKIYAEGRAITIYIMGKLKKIYMAATMEDMGPQDNKLYKDVMPLLEKLYIKGGQDDPNNKHEHAQETYEEIARIINKIKIGDLL
jgi:hypothetical protein